MTNWPERSVRSADDLLAQLLELRPYGAFRGQASAKWQLCPSLLRPCAQDAGARKPNHEKELIKSFCRHAKRYVWGPERVHADESDLVRALPLARHYGVPTRALDWTINPFVAAYFACASAQPDLDGVDGVVWWFDGRHFCEGGTFEGRLNRYWETHKFARRPADNEIDLSTLLEEHTLPDREFVTKLYYARTIDRMVRQEAFLTVAGSLTVCQARMIGALSNPICERILIPAELKQGVLEELGHMGVHAAALGDTILDQIARDHC